MTSGSRVRSVSPARTTGTRDIALIDLLEAELRQVLGRHRLEEDQLDPIDIGEDIS